MKSRGFTLLEILLVLGIMGAVVAYTISISHSIRNLTKVQGTRGKMEQIATTIGGFYRGHTNLPDPGTTPANSVPVDALNMEQGFRLDGWGQYIFYDRAQNSAVIEIDQYFGGRMVRFEANTQTLIRGIVVNGRNVAGVLISYGPNQVENFSTSGTDPITYTLDNGSDDIIIPINVSTLAIEIAQGKLKTLQEQVRAFDAAYRGIDNDGDYVIPVPNPLPPGTGLDEDGCLRQEPGGLGNCPPSGAMANDPNCGTATLDGIKANYYGTDCVRTCRLPNDRPWGAVTTHYSSPRDETDDDAGRAFIYCLYCLASSDVVDPWLNGYVWGCGDTACTNNFSSSDPHYHKFFSAGPDGAVNTADDIIP